MNCLDALARQVRANPERPALICSSQSFTFRQLWRVVGVMAWQFQQHGVGVGDSVCFSRVGVQTHFLGVLALARIGAVSSSVPPSMPAEAKREIARRHSVQFWVHGEAESWGEAEGIRMIPERAIRASSTAKAPGLARGLQDGIFRISLSSGTTGSSKSVPWTHRQRERVQRNSLDLYPAGPGERLMVFADIATGVALGHAMNHLAGGGAVILPDNAIAADCFALMLMAQPTRMTTTTALASSMAGHAAARPGWTAPVPGLLSVMMSGAAVAPALMRSFEQLVCPNVLVSYGSTEVGTMARSDPSRRLSNPDSAGGIVPWVEAQVVDENDGPLAAGETGLLRFRARNDAMATHYLDDPDATAKAFRNGWFYPGDRGAIDSDGNLFLRGRSDDVPNLGGLKVDPARIEQLLNRQPGVQESAMVQVQLEGGRQALVAAVVHDADVDLAALRKRLRDEGGPRVLIASVARLPRTQAGKLDRAALASALARSVGSKLAAGKKAD